MSNTNNSNLKPMRQQPGNSWVIEAAGGKLTYNTNNIPMQSLMEKLEEKLKTKTPLEVEAALNAL